MVRKLLLVLLWFPFTLVLLLLNLSMLSAMSRLQKPTLPLSAIPPNESSFAASSGTAQVLSASVIAGDARTLLLENFLQKNDSPMQPYAELIVQQADRYGLPFQLLPAIAMCESNLGKHVPLKAGFNPLGLAVYTGTKTGKNFDSWQHAITWASQYVYDRYYSQGITQLRDMEKIWSPPSATGDHQWSNCVAFFEENIL